MIEKVIHKNTLLKAYRECLKKINWYKKIVTQNTKIVKKKTKRDSEKAVQFLLAMGCLKLIDDIKLLEHKKNHLKKMIRKRTKLKK